MGDFIRQKPDSPVDDDYEFELLDLEGPLTSTMAGVSQGPPKQEHTGEQTQVRPKLKKRESLQVPLEHIGVNSRDEGYGLGHNGEPDPCSPRFSDGRHPLTTRDVTTDLGFPVMQQTNFDHGVLGSPSSNSFMANTKVYINVGGKHFATHRSTLQRFPTTRLAKLDELDPSYEYTTGEFFFDRSPKIFASILDWYRSGTLHFSHSLCGPVIKAELDFWNVDDSYIAPCCWRAYKGYEDEKRTLAVLDKALDGDLTQVSDEHARPPGCTCPMSRRQRAQRWRSILWNFLDKPQSSRAAQGWALLIFILIMMSIAVVTIKTHPYFRVPKPGNYTALQNFTNPKEALFYLTEPHFSIELIETLCMFIFIVELLLRFSAAPKKCRFFTSVYNIIDVFCVVPTLIVWIIEMVEPNFWETRQYIVLVSYNALTSVLRVSRLFKLARHYKALKILQLAVRSSFQELLLLCMLIIMGMLVFSTLIYFAEFHDADSFMHIPIGFWWSIVTMTTVGYGDYHPESGWGYLVGTLCAVSGMLATGLPIPIIASNFNHYYNFARYRDKLVQRKEKGRILATRQKSIAEGLDPDVLPGCPKCSGRPKRNNGNKIQPEAPT